MIRCFKLERKVNDLDAYVYLKKKHKLLRDMRVSCEDSLPPQDAITACLEPVLLPWDVPRPVVLQRHCRDFEAFGRAIFRPEDFIEHFAYDALEIECVVRPDGIAEDFSDDFF